MSKTPQAIAVSELITGSMRDPAPVIARYAREQQCDHIFMGAGSRDEIAGLLLRRVTRRVVELSEVPVLLLAQQLKPERD